MNKRLGYVRDFWRAARKYHLSPLGALTRFYRLSIPEQFSPKEILRLGLLDSENEFAIMSRSISKEALLRIQTGINPRNHFHFTEDKLDFHALCSRNGLPTPQLYAVCSKTGRKISALPALVTCHDVEAFLANCAFANLVIKPADGTHGDGVLVLSRQCDGRWNDGDGTLSAFEIGQLITMSNYRDWIIEERLFAAEALRWLSGTNVLQTARVVTLVNREGICDVLLAWLRITAGRARTDNFNFGTSGNIVAPIDLRTGQLGLAAKMSSDGLGLEPVCLHPHSESQIEGFGVPHWEHVLSLARKAGRRFMPLKTVGWDIAITDERPSLIEGNVTWDPLPANPNLAFALRQLVSARALDAPGAAPAARAP